VFSRYELAPGDLLLIASPKIEKLLDEGELRSILLRGGDEALVELFKIASGQQDFSLVLLACVVEAEEAVADQEPVAVGQVPEAPLEADEPTESEAAAAAAATGTPAQDEVPAPPAGLSEPKVRLKGPESDIRYRRPGGLAASIPNIPLPAALVVLVVAVVAFLGVCFLPDQLRESSEDQFDASIAAARVALDSAIASDDAAEQRGFLDAADAAIQDAAIEVPDSEEVAALRREFDELKQKLDAVLVLPDLDLIVDISERIPGAVSAKDLALGGGGAYFLDREQGRVIAVSLLGPDPDVFVLFEAGDLVGDLVAGQPRYITWADDLNALLILDDERNLIAVTPPAAGRLLTVRSADTWSSADGIDHYDDGLYVLDRAGNQVWLYLSSETGFDSERRPMLDAFDLEEVVEMAVGDVIYLIMADDTIVRFPGGATLPFTQAGIPDPLSSPASLVPAPDLGMLLLADTGNSRIVVFTPDGTYLQQLVSPSFTDLRSIALDEPNELLYILVGGILYRTPLPPLPPEDAGPTPPTPTSTDDDTTPDDAEVLTYEVVKREDVSEGSLVLVAFSVSVSSEPTKAELEEIANQLIAEETEVLDVNAIGFFFYLPDSDTSGPYTAGTGDWAPNGNWDDADTVVAGDYSTHELAILAGSILPP